MHMIKIDKQYIVSYIDEAEVTYKKYLLPPFPFLIFISRNYFGYIIN